MSILKDIKMRTLRPVKSTCPHCCRQSMHSLSRIKNNITLVCPNCGNTYLPSQSKPVK
ncbi:MULTISPECIES: YnfU family zinc-binding protein [Citrobacter]|uniref:YnfU family zinc-binding protein n=1 Tax=Citrobacter TaxID=544 RepID=UPI001BC8C7DD|nr:YnfU family zinc-binding protein [Citrobacter sp. S44_ASV_140]QXA91085.1 YnfU family zinc-binding protein [Citrobacter braakii]QXC18577.1 YnfU family zinc-binding protein [Citrobacter braakii]QYO49267.1 YnfU family zinc-binding protein [Citrobacter braakii]